MTGHEVTWYFTGKNFYNGLKLTFIQQMFKLLFGDRHHIRNAGVNRACAPERDDGHHMHDCSEQELFHRVISPKSKQKTPRERREGEL